MGKKENNPTIYKIVIAERLKEKWADWLNGVIVRIERATDNPKATAITICVPDQAALRGTLNKLWDLNLTIISVNTQNDKPT